jgi:nitrogen fixation protein NifB
VHAAIEEELAAKAAKSNGTTVVPVAMLDGRSKPRPVLMAIATTGGGVINQHFGHAKEFLVYEGSADGARFIGHRKVEDLYCSGNDTCGDGESVLGGIIRALEGCEAVLCSKIGYEPWEMLEEAGIQPNGEHAMEPIEDAVMAVYREMLEMGKLDAPAAEQEAQATA